MLRPLTYVLATVVIATVVGCEYKTSSMQTTVTTNVSDTRHLTGSLTHVEALESTNSMSWVAEAAIEEKTGVTVNLVEPATRTDATQKFSYTLSVRDAQLEGLVLLTGSHGTPEQPVATWGPRDQAKYARFTVTTIERGPYVLSVTLASGGSHPFDVLVNGVHVLTNVCGENTGGYDVAFAKRLLAGTIHLLQGTNKIALRVNASSPCIASITLER